VGWRRVGHVEHGELALALCALGFGTVRSCLCLWSTAGRWTVASKLAVEERILAISLTGVLQAGPLPVRMIEFPARSTLPLTRPRIDRDARHLGPSA